MVKWNTWLSGSRNKRLYKSLNMHPSEKNKNSLYCSTVT